MNRPLHNRWVRRPFQVTVVIGAFVTLAALGGCGSGTSGSGASGSGTTAPTVWSTQQAAREYLKMVKVTNRNYEAWEGKAKSPHNIRDYAKGVVVREDKFVRLLAAGRWPGVVRGDVNRVISTWNADRPYWRDVYRAATKDEAWAAWLRVPDGKAGAAAVANVRTKLGLPPVPD